MLQQNNKEEDKDQVVIVLLDMLEVGTRDIIDEEISRYVLWLELPFFYTSVSIYFIPPLCSLVESSHGGSSGKDGKSRSLDRLFDKLNFPIPETEAWKEKVSSM